MYGTPKRYSLREVGYQALCRHLTFDHLVHFLDLLMVIRSVTWYQGCRVMYINILVIVTITIGNTTLRYYHIVLSSVRRLWCYTGDRIIVKYIFFNVQQFVFIISNSIHLTVSCKHVSVDARIRLAFIHQAHPQNVIKN